MKITDDTPSDPKKEPKIPITQKNLDQLRIQAAKAGYYLNEANLEIIDENH